MKNEHFCMSDIYSRALIHKLPFAIVRSRESEQEVFLDLYRICNMQLYIKRNFIVRFYTII